MQKVGKGALPPNDLEDLIPPCPFCGGTITIQHDTKTYGYDREAEMDIYWAQCECNMTGPRFNNSNMNLAKEQDPKQAALNWALKRYGHEHGLIVREADFIKDPEKYLAKRKVTKISVFGVQNKKLLEFPKFDV